MVILNSGPIAGKREGVHLAHWGRNDLERGSHRTETGLLGVPCPCGASSLGPTPPTSTHTCSKCWQLEDPHSARVRFEGWLSLPLQMGTGVPYKDESCSLLPMREGTVLSSSGLPRWALEDILQR